MCVFNCKNVISCETVFVKVLQSKGWIVEVRNDSIMENTIMEKTEEEGGRVKDN